MNSRNIKIIGGVIITLIVVLGAIFVVRPLVTSITNSPEITAAQSQNDSLQKQLQNLSGVKQQTAQLTKIRAQLVRQFPNTANVPDLINLISLAASNAGIAPTNITSFNFSAPVLGTPAPAASGAAPAPAASGAAATPAPGATAGTTTNASQYASLGISLSVKGSSAQFAKFMQSITSLRRIFTISNFSITGTGGDATLSITGTTYIYRDIPAPGTTTSAPAAVPTAATAQ